MPIYALGDRDAHDPPRRLHPPRRRRHRRRPHRRRLVGLAGRRAARRLRHDHRGRAHVDPGRRRDPRGRRIPDGHRRRLRDRPPRAPRGLRDRGPRPRGQRLDRAARGRRAQRARRSARGPSCAIGWTCRPTPWPSGCPPTMQTRRRGEDAHRRDLAALYVANARRYRGELRCSRRSRSRRGARARAAACPSSDARAGELEASLSDVARPATISARAAFAHTTSKTGPGSARRGRTAPPRRCARRRRRGCSPTSWWRPSSRRRRPVRLVRPSGVITASVDGAPSESSSSPSSAFTRIA